MGKSNATPYIGSYVLETLTTGMYGQSENALREYVQNSFDSIRQAVRLGMILKEEGPNKHCPSRLQTWRLQMLHPPPQTLADVDTTYSNITCAVSGCTVHVCSSSISPQ